jgi:hypothetical protein
MFGKHVNHESECAGCLKKEKRKEEFKRIWCLDEIFLSYGIATGNE